MDCKKVDVNISLQEGGFESVSVLFIKNNINKYKQTELSKMFNVSRRVIYQIKKGITYKNVN